jgi:periplasmic divalent cation tolerance protein
MDECRVILSTASSIEEAARIGRLLVERQLAACVNLVPGLRSIYRWEGRVCDDAEVLLVIKTRAGLTAAVLEAIRAMHSYQLPEAIALPIIDGSPDYLAWLIRATQPPGPTASP